MRRAPAREATWALVLGAIGPAAADTLPDLRRWCAWTGDIEGHVRDAIARITATPR